MNTKQKKGKNLIMFALFLLNLINLCLILFMIIFEHKKLNRVALWLLVFTTLPILGFLLYLLLGFGVIKKNKKLMQIYNYNLIYKNNIKNNFQNIRGKFSEIQKFNLLNNNSLVLNNEKVEIYSNGKDTFNKIKEDLLKAKNNIYILSYIFADDIIGQEIKKILKQKAKKGVEIVIIYDSFGSKKTKYKFFKDLKEKNIKVLEFFPPILKLRFLQLDINYRNHRKILIIDNNIAYIGGINIRDDHLGRKKELSPWRDTHIKLIGNSVLELLRVFICDSKLCNNKNGFLIKNVLIKYNGLIKSQVLNSSPIISNPKIEESILKIINSAKKEIIIQTPYLILDDKLLFAIKQAVLSNKEVIIFIPKLADKKLVYNATLFYCKSLLEIGVKIYRYKGFLHSKCMLVDKEIFLIGSSNFDMRSFNLNFETSMLFYDKKLAKKYYEIILEDIKNSEELFLNDLKKLPTFKKLAISFCKLFSPIL